MNKILQSSFVIFVFIAFDCDLNKDTSNIIMSNYGSMDSHNVGEDCMQCHKSDGEAGLEFSIAGSVYDSSLNRPYPNVLITLLSDIDINDIPEEVIEVDGKGNFYSNMPINWQNGLLASVSNNNQIRNMIGINSDGSCNSCHNGIDLPHINIE